MVIHWYWILEWLSKECPGFCVVMPRLSREGDAPDFARLGWSKLAVGSGNWALLLHGLVLVCARAGPPGRGGLHRSSYVDEMLCSLSAAPLQAPAF